MLSLALFLFLPGEEHSAACSESESPEVVQEHFCFPGTEHRTEVIREIGSHSVGVRPLAARSATERHRAMVLDMERTAV